MCHMCLLFVTKIEDDHQQNHWGSKILYKTVWDVLDELQGMKD